MRQWVLVGMERFRVSEAIRAYQEAEVDLRGCGRTGRVARGRIIGRNGNSQGLPCSINRKILGLA